jgi:catalase
MPSTNWQEKIDPGEPARFEKYAEQLRDLQRRKARSGKADRALHAKGQLALAASFTVLPGLPEHARAGLFAQPGAFQALVRYSNGSGSRQSDAKPDVRGVAVKLLGVPGKKLIPGMEDAQTQDFLLIRTSSTPFRNADEFVPFVAAVVTPLTGLPKVIGKLGFGRTLQILKQATRQLGTPLRPLSVTHYYSAVPIRFGAHAVKYGLRPVQQDDGRKLQKSPDSLAQDLANQVKSQPIAYDFQLQFFEDEARTPIEDASKDWDAPWLTVGRLEIPAQDTDSPRGRQIAELAEAVSFDPWHAQQELRPIGNMMRARNAAYRLSTQERKAAPEPDALP